MVGLYLTPIVRTFDRNGAFHRNPACLDVAHACPGYRRAVMKSTRQKDDAALMFVEADDLSPLDAARTATRLAVGRSFTDLYQDDVTPLDARDAGVDVTVDAACASLGAARAASVGGTVRALMLAVEPAARPDMFDAPTPEKTGSITDDFAGSGALGAGWAVVLGSATWARTSGQLTVNGGGTDAIRRTEAAFPNDQWSQLDITYPADDSHLGIGVRLSAIGEGYFLFVGSADIVVKFWQGGGSTYLSDAGTGHSNPNTYTIKLDVTGTTITWYQGGVSQGTVTDSTFASGKPGVFYLEGTAGGVMDNFVCIDAVSSFIARPNKQPRQAVQRAASW